MLYSLWLGKKSSLRYSSAVENSLIMCKSLDFEGRLHAVKGVFHFPFFFLFLQKFLCQFAVNEQFDPKFLLLTFRDALQPQLEECASKMQYFFHNVTQYDGYDFDYFDLFAKSTSRR